MATLQEAINYARQNPQSDFAIQLKQRIQSGQADQDAAKEGIDLGWAGRKSVATSVVQPVEAPKQKGTLLGPLKEGISGLKTLYGGGEQGIAMKLKRDIEDGAADIEKGVAEGGLSGFGTATKGVLKAGL